MATIAETIIQDPPQEFIEQAIADRPEGMSEFTATVLMQTEYDGRGEAPLFMYTDTASPTQPGPGLYAEQHPDFDSEISDLAGNGGMHGLRLRYPVDEEAWRGLHFAQVAHDSAKAWKARTGRSVNEDGSIVPEQAGQPVDERVIGDLAIKVVINAAPRSDEHVEGEKNGAPFYVAILSSGVKVYTTDLSQLRHLEASDEITGLWEIPNKGNKEWKDGTQYRSDDVARTGVHLHDLTKLYDYGSREELRAAKDVGKHPDYIKEDTRSAFFGFADKFGNTLIYYNQYLGKQIAQNIGRTAILRVINDPQSDSPQNTRDIAVRIVADSMENAPNNIPAIYLSIDDEQDPEAKTGRCEFVNRVQKCNATDIEGLPDNELRAFHLLKKDANFDIVKAAVELITDEAEVEKILEEQAAAQTVTV